MNKIYRIVWNEARGAFVVAHEKSKANGKPSTTRKVIVEAVTAAMILLNAPAALATPPSCSSPANGSGHYTLTPSGVSVGTGVTLSGSSSAMSGTGITTTSCGITNSGTLTGQPTYAGLILNTSTIAGGILNNATGSISGGRAGIYLTHSFVSGAINNAGGNISANSSNAQGISIQASSLTGGITNSGTISAVNLGEGISVDGGSTVSVITNSGTISAGSRGILVGGSSTVSSGITNSGTINNPSIGLGSGIVNAGIVNGGITNIAGGTISGFQEGIGVSYGTVSGGINNSGVISDGVGIWLAHANVDSVSNNTGGSISALSYGALLITHSTVSGSINNSGLISTVNYAPGIYIYGSSTVGGGITNSGTISVSTNTRAIRIQSSTISGGITNSGTITGGAGLFVGTNSTVSGGITNSGSISGHSGIFVGSSTVNGGITNSGTISSNGSSGYGIYVRGSVNGDITNSGTISMGHGLFLSGSTVSGGIANSGLISSNATSGVGITLFNSSVSGAVNNSGSISANGSRGIGIAINSSTVGGGITNSGTISALGSAGLLVAHSSVGGDIVNTGTISTSAVHAWAMQIISNTVSGGITNSGVLTAASGTGLNLYGHNTISGGISNSGTIIAGNTGIFLGSGTVAGGISNSGTITSAQTGINVVRSATVTGGIINSGTISGGTWSIHVDDTSSVDFINNQAGGLLSGNIYVGDAATTVTNAGTIWLPESSTSTIAGNYTQSSSGVFKIDASSSTSYGKLTVGGTASIAGTAYVNVNSVHTLASGETLLGVISAGTLSGNFASVNTNSNLFSFGSVVDGNNIDLCVAAAGASCGSGGSGGASTVVIDTKSNGNNPGLGAATVLDDLIAKGTNAPAAMNSVITALGQMTDSKQVSNAVSQTLPLHTGGETVAITGSLHSVNHIVQSRQEGEQGRSSGDGFVEDGRAWAKPFGSYAKQGDYDGVSGFSALTGGLVIGADGNVSSASRMGAAVAIANTDVSGNSSVAPQSSTVATYQLAIYGSHSLSENTDINFLAGVGDHINKGNREIVFMGTTAQSSYRSLSEQLGVGIANTMKLSDVTTFTPSVRADYTTVHNNAYDETGAGALNLSVDKSIVNEMLISADGKFTHKLDDNSLLTANLGVGYDALNKQNSIVSAFAGDPTASFTTMGMNQSAWMVRGGLGYVHTEKTTEVTVRYDVDANSTQFVDQTVSMKFRWSF